MPVDSPITIALPPAAFGGTIDRHRPCVVIFRVSRPTAVKSTIDGLKSVKRLCQVKYLGPGPVNQYPRLQLTATLKGRNVGFQVLVEDCVSPEGLFEVEY